MLLVYSIRPRNENNSHFLEITERKWLNEVYVKYEELIILTPFLPSLQHLQILREKLSELVTPDKTNLQSAVHNSPCPPTLKYK